MEECCYSLLAPPPSLLFPISENSTSIHPASQPGNRCLFASLSLSSPTQRPINFPPHFSHHQHSPLLFTWWIYSVTSSLNSLQRWPFSIPSSLIAIVILKKKNNQKTKKAYAPSPLFEAFLHFPLTFNIKTCILTMTCWASCELPSSSPPSSLATVPLTAFLQWWPLHQVLEYTILFSISGPLPIIWPMTKNIISSLHPHS